MYPVSVAGRIITCFCALFGPVTMGMLVSVIVDRYQRVYNRKMYITEPDISPADLDGLSLSGESHRSIFTPQNMFRKWDHSRSIQSNMTKLKNQSNHSLAPKVRQPHQFQFHVVISRDNHDETAVERVITVMKRKLTEALSSTDTDVQLRLIDSDDQELWTTSSASNPAPLVAPIITVTMQHDDEDEDNPNEIKADHEQYSNACHL